MRAGNLKLIYVCECCDMIVHSLEMEDLGPGDSLAALTGTEPQNIIEMSGSGDQVTLPTLCGECLEDMYGRPENTYISGPVLN
jgi:hypothetical protein